MKKEIKWSIDHAHSQIEFKIRHLMIAYTKGSFKTFDANIYTTGKDFTSAVVDLWISANSITTDDETRDAHLKSPEFFDVQKFEQITFVSGSIVKLDAEGNHEMYGELTIKGITKEVKLYAQFGGIVNDPWGNERAGFTISGKINKNDWGLTWNTVLESGGLMLSNEVTIMCEVELIHTPGKDKALKLKEEEEVETALEKNDIL